MRLVNVAIEGYRSIKGRIEVKLDPRVTVLLGANDHGKSNFLEALRHLNADAHFEAEDLNWDMADRAEAFPAVRYELDLNEEERGRLSRIHAGERLLAAAQASRVERTEELGELRKELREREEAIGDASLIEEAAARAKEAQTAAESDPENAELRAAATQAAAEVREIEDSRRIAQQGIDEKANWVNTLSLAVALADARAIEGEALREGTDVTTAVESRALAAEADHQSKSRALKKAAAKLKSTQSTLEELPDETEEAARQQAERAVEVSRSEMSAASDEAGKCEAEAQRLRASTEALARRVEEDQTAEFVDLPVDELTERHSVPSRITAVRVGLRGELDLDLPDGVDPAAVRRFLEAEIPRVVLVSPVDRLPDDVSLNQLADEKSAFMRGIFLYAGLDPREWDDLFVRIRAPACDCSGHRRS